MPKIVALIPKSRAKIEALLHSIEGHCLSLDHFIFCRVSERAIYLAQNLTYFNVFIFFYLEVYGPIFLMSFRKLYVFRRKTLKVCRIIYTSSGL